ncbi:MAG: AIR synthase-related protein [Thermomicrobiales bacterium]
MSTTNEAADGGRPQSMILKDEEQILNVGKLPNDLLARLIDTYTSSDPSVIVGPGVGCDAAAVTVDGATLAIKSDPITFATDDAPRYLVNVNANDIACLGATPRWLSVTSLLPEGTTTLEFVERQFRELREACDECGVTLVGGHTEVTLGLTRPILVGQMLGTPSPTGLLVPGGMRPGDRLLVTKAIAIEGTALLARELSAVLTVDHGGAFVERAKHLLYEPGISIVREARLLLAAGGVTALHDPTEGGLATGVRELAIAGGCGVRLNRTAIPILPETAAVASGLGLDPLGMLASGSLLAAVAPGAVEGAIEACHQADIPINEIGVATTAEEGFSLVFDGGLIDLPSFQADEVSRVLG